jgi:hypothetical protein
MMVNDIQPQTNIEWLWTLDLVELSWEILRYRHLKKRILDVHRGAAIKSILERLDGEGMPAEAAPMVQMQTKRAAAQWRDDPDAAIDIEARLHRSGFDNIDINAEVFVQARELFEMFDQLIQLAQNRRIGLLCEISIRREFARRPAASSGRWTDLEGRVRHPHDVGHTIYSLAALFARAVEACASSGAGAIAFDLFQP